MQDSFELQALVHTILTVKGFYMLPLQDLSFIRDILAIPYVLNDEQTYNKILKEIIKIHQNEKNIRAFIWSNRNANIPQFIKEYLLIIIELVHKTIKENQNQLENITDFIFPFAPIDQQAPLLLGKHLYPTNQTHDHLQQSNQKKSIKEGEQKVNQKAKGVSVKVQTNLMLIDEDFQVQSVLSDDDNQGQYGGVFRKIVQKSRDQNKNQVQYFNGFQQYAKKQQNSYKEQNDIINMTKQQRNCIKRIHKIALQQSKNENFKEEIKHLQKLPSIDPSFKQKLSKNEKQNKNFTQCPCEGSINDLPFFTCYNCNENYHYECLLFPQDNMKRLCPSCTIINIKPLRKVQETVYFCYFRDIFKKKVDCKINLQQYEYYCSQLHRKYSIEFRCLRFSRSLRLPELKWPENCSISINKKVRIIFPDQKQQNQCLYMENYIYQSNHGPLMNQKTSVIIQENYVNQNQIEQINEQNEEYFFFFGIFFVFQETYQNIYSNLLKMIQPCTKSYIDSLIDLKKHQEIANQTVSCSIKDPFSQKIMKIPVRGIYCQHVQCFELSTYLLKVIRQKCYEWKCPLCEKITITLVVDPILVQLINNCVQYHVIPTQIIFEKNNQANIVLSNNIEKKSDEHSNEILEAYFKNKLIQKKKGKFRFQKGQNIPNIIKKRHKKWKWKEVVMPNDFEMQSRNMQQYSSINDNSLYDFESQDQKEKEDLIQIEVMQKNHSKKAWIEVESNSDEE